MRRGGARISYSLEYQRTEPMAYKAVRVFLKAWDYKKKLPVRGKASPVFRLPSPVAGAA